VFMVTEAAAIGMCYGRSMNGARSRSKWDKLLPAVMAAVVVSLISVVLMQWWGGAERVRALVAGVGPWAPLVFVLLKASTYVIAPLSGAPLIIAAGTLFGFWEGLALTLTGETLGACLNFWIARLLGRPGIRRFAGPGAIRRVDDAVAHVGGWRALLVANVFFSAFYDFISYAAGLSNLPFRHFFWVTVAGAVPGLTLYVFIGDRLTGGPGVAYLLVGVLVLLGAVMWVRRRRLARG